MGVLRSVVDQEEDAGRRERFDQGVQQCLGLGGNQSYPDVFQPFGGFAVATPVENGYVSMPDVPGVGFEAKAQLWKVMKAVAN